MYSEEIITLGKNNQSVGVFTSPNSNQIENSLCIVFINAGIIHKVGPNRIYVKIARRLSESGFSSFRFDFNDTLVNQLNSANSDENSQKNQEIKEVLDTLEVSTQCKEFILFGICSGAEEIFNYDIEDSRVKGIALIDGTYQKYEAAQELYKKAFESSQARYYKKHAFSISRWKKLLTGKSNILNKKKILSLIKKVAPVKSGKTEAFSDNTFDEKVLKLNIWKQIFKKQKYVLLIFCEGGTAIDLFNFTLRPHLKSDYLTLEYIKNVDHTFTPQWSQDLLIDILQKWVSKVKL